MDGFSKMGPRGSEEKTGQWLQVLLHSCVRETLAGTMGWNRAGVNAALPRELCQAQPLHSAEFCWKMVKFKQDCTTLMSPHFCICLKKKKAGFASQILRILVANLNSGTSFVGNVLMNTQQKCSFFRKENKTTKNPNPNQKRNNL